MKIKISEILIESISQEVLIDKWNTDNPKSFNFSAFNKIDLKVPIIIRGQKANIIVASKINLKENSRGVELHFYSDFTKCIFYSFLIGVFPSLLFLLLYSSIILCSVFALLISIGVFRIFYMNTQKVSKNYLKQVKQKFI